MSKHFGATTQREAMSYRAITFYLYLIAPVSRRVIVSCKGCHNFLNKLIPDKRT